MQPLNLSLMSCFLAGFVLHMLLEESLFIRSFPKQWPLRLDEVADLLQHAPPFR